MNTNYKNRVDSTKAALFGSAAGTGAGVGGASRNPNKATSKINSVTTNSASNTNSISAASKWTGKIDLKNALTPEQKVSKMNEAEDYRKRAKKFMTPGFFSSADPVSATTYYKKAADLVKACDEPKLEMLLRLSAAELNDDRLAAAEYSRAAELAARVEGYEVEKASHYYQCSSQLYLENGDNGKAAENMSRAGSVFIDPMTKSPQTGYENECLKHLENSISMFVPILLNPRRKYACTLENDDTLNERNARELVVTSPNAGKFVSSVMVQLIEMGELSSALYAAGAVSYLYTHDGISTVSLNRAYLNETILILAMGDSIAANEVMLDHFQNTSYLSSRECELEENLVRAIQSCDEGALMKCKQAPVLNNIDRIVVELVQCIRVLGAAVKQKSQPEVSHVVHESEGNDDHDAITREMDKIMNNLEIEDDEEEEFDLT